MKKATAICLFIITALITLNTVRASALTVTKAAGETIHVYTPVVAAFNDINIPLSGVYAEFTVTPDNTGYHAVYGTSNFLLSASKNVMTAETDRNITNNNLNAYANAVSFPFGVWDKATGKYYPPETLITLGTDYDTDGKALISTTFVTTAYAVKEMHDMGTNLAATTSIAVNAPLNVLAQNRLFRKGTGGRLLDFNPLISAYYGNGYNTEEQYLAYKTGAMNASTSPDKIVADGNAVNDMITHSRDYMFMGEEVDFYIDTAGAYATNACNIVLTPRYVITDLSGSTVDADLYYGFYYDINKGITKHMMKIGEDDAEIPYSLKLDLDAPPSSYEFEQTNILLGLNSTNTSEWNVTRKYSGMTLPNTARFIRDISSEIDETLQNPLTYGTGFTDINHDGISDEIQKSQIRWYGSVSTPEDIYVVKQNLKMGYCDNCHSSRFVSLGVNKCPECGRNLSNLKVFDLRENEQLVIYNYYDEFLIKEGYVTITLDVTVTDDYGNIYTKTGIPVYDKNGNEISLKFKIGTKASSKWVVVY